MECDGSRDAINQAKHSVSFVQTVVRTGSQTSTTAAPKAAKLVHVALKTSSAGADDATAAPKVVTRKVAAHKKAQIVAAVKPATATKAVHNKMTAAPKSAMAKDKVLQAQIAELEAAISKERKKSI